MIEIDAPYRCPSCGRLPHWNAVVMAMAMANTTVVSYDWYRRPSAPILPGVTQRQIRAATLSLSEEMCQRNGRDAGEDKAREIARRLKAEEERIDDLVAAKVADDELCFGDPSHQYHTHDDDPDDGADVAASYWRATPP